MIGYMATSSTSAPQRRSKPASREDSSNWEMTTPAFARNSCTNRPCSALTGAGCPCLPQGAYYVLADISRCPARPARAGHASLEGTESPVPGRHFQREDGAVLPASASPKRTRNPRRRRRLSTELSSTTELPGTGLRHSMIHTLDSHDPAPRRMFWRSPAAGRAGLPRSRQSQFWRDFTQALVDHNKQYEGHQVQMDAQAIPWAEGSFDICSLRLFMLPGRSLSL